MNVFIDADGCPVVDITVRICKKYSIKCYIICDTSHIFYNDYAETVIVSKGADSVDFKLVNMLSDCDIAVTQDYGLAAMCLSRKAAVINQNGLIYDNKNIDELLFSRYVSKKIRASGGRLKGPSKRTDEQNENFSKVLSSLIESKLGE